MGFLGVSNLTKVSKLLGFYLDLCESGDDNPRYYSPCSLYGQLFRLLDDEDITPFKLPHLFLCTFWHKLYMRHTRFVYAELIAHPHIQVWAANERFLLAGALLKLVQPVRAIDCNQCWYSPFTSGPHQYVWVGYRFNLIEPLWRAQITSL